MNRAVRVTAEAREQIALLDAGLKEELVRQVVAIADAPAEWLHAATDPLFSGLLEASYRSEAAYGIMVVVYFSGLDADPPGLTLEFLMHTQEVDDPEAK